MVKRFLVTTALEETWPEEDQPVLFLGEWCRLYSRKERWSIMNAEVLPYHWDNRKKLYRDYQYLKGLYEQMLGSLTEQLNEIHNVDHSLRYWRILIGPWLGYFIQMLFDRWSSIEQALNSYEIEETTILDCPPESLVSQGMWDFQDYLISDPWNHHLYAEILQRVGKMSFQRLQAKPFKPRNSNSSSMQPINKRFLNTMAKQIFQAISFFENNDDAFFISTYLPYKMQWELDRKLKQLPQLRQRIPAPNVLPDLNQRRWSLGLSSISEFEELAEELIPQIIPSLYLEGYHSLVELTHQIGWPQNPKLIWTSNSYNSDDVFKAWAAEKIEAGSPLVIGQHGGHYGTGLWSFIEEHEIAISDRYFSWGWDEPEKPKVQPVGQIKHKIPLGVNHAEQSGLLLVTSTMPRYSYHMYSTLVSSQWLDYLEDQFTFTENLLPVIQNELTVRLYINDYGWDQEKRWRDRFPNVALDLGKKNINELISGSRLYVSTYNAATYLESFTMNVPTVIFWNPNHWELRESALPYFNKLKEVGVLHETPESAARHIELIWDDLDGWWSNIKVKNAVQQFCARFAYISPNITDIIHKEILDIVRS